jgi:membrane-associated phospholipid phosphatase
MANAATSQAYALNFSVASEKFYGIAQGTTFDILLVVTTQMIGFGMAGLCRRFLVWPAALIWPQNLVFCTLLNTLHAEDDDGNSGGLTRYRFFTYVICGAFFWYLLPGESRLFARGSSLLTVFAGFLFQALSVFSFICWAAPSAFTPLC